MSGIFVTVEYFVVELNIPLDGHLDSLLFLLPHIALQKFFVINVSL